ncbi:hypothetical protein L1D36_27580, partial [Vibrio mediterranei]|nr:hypothetical protein [Vibrio mediterranei]
MKKLALVISGLFLSSSVMAVELGDFESDWLLETFDIQDRDYADNQSDIQMGYTSDNRVVVKQGASGNDGNRSAIDMMQPNSSGGNNNDVRVFQDGNAKADSVVRVKGTSGGNDIDVRQRGEYDDSIVALWGDSDRNEIDIRQSNSADDNHTVVRLRGSSSDDNDILVEQTGDRSMSRINLVNSGGNDANNFGFTGSHGIHVSQTSYDYSNI